MKNLFCIIIALICLCGYLKVVYRELPINHPACQSIRTLAEYTANGPWYGIIYNCSNLDGWDLFLARE